MLFGEEGGITVIGEVCQGKILPLSLELLGAAKKLAQEMNCPVSFVFAGWKMDAEVMKMKHYGIDEIL
jgi:electron transfer flavoprotein alpha subunit